MTTLDDSLRRIPPQNLEAESSVLGAVFIEQSCLEEVTAILSINDFYREAHRKIFRAMIEITGRGEPMDLITLSDYLKNKHELEGIGGSAYLAALADFVPTAANVGQYANIVKQCSIKRSLFSVLGSSIEQVETEDPQKLIAKVTSQIAEISNGADPVTGPDPQPLPDELPPVPAMVPKMIPTSFRDWLCDIADRMQCPLDFPVIGATTITGSLIGRRLAIRPKKEDDWTVVPNLWGGVVGRPGIMKSPALDEAKKPLQRLEIDALKDQESQKQAHELNLMIVKAKKDELQKKIRNAIAEGDSTDGFEIPTEEELILRRYMVNDSTVEKLGEILNQNPNGLLLFRDELTGWLRTLDRDGHENDRAFYLEAWNGNGSYTYDRIGRGTLSIEAACVSILGGIQPGPLSDYLISTLKGGAGADGLFQRFQLLVYPDDPGPWKNVDRWPNTKAKNAAFEIFKKLAADDFVDTVGGEPGDESCSIRFLRFSPEGQDFFDEWRRELENKIRSGEEHPAVEAHLSKYRSLMPSLALIFHVISALGSPSGNLPRVSLTAAQMAAAWCDYLEAHARRIYQGLIQRDISTVHRLAKKIVTRKLQSPFTAREVYRNGWTGLSEGEEIEAGAAILDELGWIKTEQVAAGANGGRPTVRYRINPKLLNGKAD